ncbi:MAG: peptidoglycan DD-metalloendopeptidase family protein [Gemmatimonadales bacterium]
MSSRFAATLFLVAACSPDGQPDLPEVRFGMYVLARDTAPDGTIWVGTYDHGLWRLTPGAIAWDSVPGMEPVHAFTFQGDTIWVATVGHGWARSPDDGASWDRWTMARGTTPAGLARRGDTIYVATLEGLYTTQDHGRTWRVMPGLRHPYLLAFTAVGARLYASHGRGVEVSQDGGRSWTFIVPPDEDLHKVRQFAAPGEGPDRLVRFVTTPATPGRAQLVWYRPGRADSAAAPRHAWFVRPIADGEQTYLDQTVRYGDRREGAVHRGVDVPNALGTVVGVIGDGVVQFTGDSPLGRTVVVRHDRQLTAGDSVFAVFSVYGHLEAVETGRGRRVAPGEPLGRVGATGGATSPRLHLEIHAVPRALADSLALIVGPLSGRYATNPELWLAPVRHAGIVAGTVRLGDARVRGIRIYGLTKLLPHEWPLAFVTTYDADVSSSPAYGEDFAITDVPPGDYLIGVDLEGRRQFRSINVQPGAVTWVVFGR